MNIGTSYGLALASGIDAYIPLLSYAICARFFHLFNGMWQGVPCEHRMRRNGHVQSTPSLPLLSSLDCFVHVCYPVPVGLGTLVRQRETVRLRVLSQLNVGRSEREPTLR